MGIELAQYVKMCQWPGFIGQHSYTKHVGRESTVDHSRTVTDVCNMEKWLKVAKQCIGC